MTALTLFPARIRFTNPDGTLTPEALRMLELLVNRVGGSIGDLGDDVHATPEEEHGPVDDIVQACPPAPEAVEVLVQPAASTSCSPEMILQPPPVAVDQVEGLGSMAKQDVGTNFTGSFTDKTVTVSNGIIISVV